MRRVALAICALVLVGRPAAAAAGRGQVTGTVTVTDHEGKQVSAEGAIVYVVGFADEPPRATPEIVQLKKRFVPDLIAITVGQAVSFPNADPILHNVFSRSPARRFDLGSYKKGQSKSKAFRKTGVVDVYCNIHPEMAATILVLPNRRHTRVAADGSFTIDDVPEGTWTVFAYTRLVERPAQAELTVAGGETTEIDLDLALQAPVDHANKYGEGYRDPERYR